MAPPLIVLGTGNRKKGLEMAELLAPLGIDLRTLSDFDNAIEVVEDGQTFADNAAKKATEQARHLGHWVIGEDSGLSVDALGGAPGVYSARYSGDEATDQSNNEKLLAQLAETPLARRTAYYTCHMAISDPAGKLRAGVERTCRGRILFAPSGDAGFGYDPLFEIPEYHQTFGRLGRAVKSVLSHRARAVTELLPQLRRLLFD